MRFNTRLPFLAALALAALALAALWAAALAFSGGALAHGGCAAASSPDAGRTAQAAVSHGAHVAAGQAHAATRDTSGQKHGQKHDQARGLEHGHAAATGSQGDAGHSSATDCCGAPGCPMVCHGVAPTAVSALLGPSRSARAVPYEPPHPPALPAEVALPPPRLLA